MTDDNYRMERRFRASAVVAAWTAERRSSRQNVRCGQVLQMGEHLDRSMTPAQVRGKPLPRENSNVTLGQIRNWLLLRIDD